MRNTSPRACAIVVAVAVMFAIGGTLSAPAAVLAQTGQKTSGTAGKAGPSYTVCTPSASNNYCKQTGPIGEAAPAGGGGANNGDYGCVSYGKCSQANVSSGDLMITVEPGFTNMPNLAKFAEPVRSAMAAQPAPYYATLSVTHNDHNSSCEKIYQVVVNTEWNGGHVDVAHATVSNDGECNFSNFTFRFQPVSIGEVQACTAGGVLKDLHVVLMSHNMLGQLTKDDHSDTFTTARVFVSCPKLTPRAVAVTPVTYRGACPAGVAVAGSYDANGKGPMSTVWTFGNGSIVHGSSAANTGHNTVGLAPTRMAVSVSTTVSLSVAGPGGTVASPAVPYVVQCLPPVKTVTASSSVLARTGNFCPAQVAFDGTIGVDMAVLGNSILTARWNGDGNTTHDAPLTFSGGAYHTRLVLSLPNGARGTMSLRTLTPTSVTSAPVTYEVHCNPPPTGTVAAPKGGIPTPAAKPVVKKPLPPPRKPNIP